MSNDKEIIKKLLAIATKQQKIITKLAQTVPASHEPPPTHLKPSTTHQSPEDAAKLLFDGLDAASKANVESVTVADGTSLMAKFKPGRLNQPNYDKVLATLQKLTDSGTIQSKWALKYS